MRQREGAKIGCNDENESVGNKEPEFGGVEESGGGEIESVNYGNINENG